MKRFSFGEIFCAAMLFVSCASLSVKESPVSSVWEISRDGQRLFLGGSCHILRETDFPPPAAFDMAFDKSGVLVLEADLEQMSDPEVLQSIQARMLLPEGKKLDSVLSGEVYTLLEQEFQKFGVPSLEPLAQYKAPAVVMTLSALDIQQFGFIAQGIDFYYFDRAKQSGKALDFLETVDFQIDLLLAMGEGYEDDFVRYSLLDRENTGKHLDTLVAEWRTGGAEFLEAELLVMKNTWPEIYQALMADRNSNWLPKVEAYLRTGPVEFVLVGLAHLHGPDGLLRQLQSRGYTVKQFEGAP
jgi:uncharacterized protein YbaP (TraB family)